MVVIEHMNAEQLKKWYEWYSETVNKAIPDYNKPDFDNDTLDVLKAKILAIVDSHGSD